MNINTREWHKRLDLHMRHGKEGVPFTNTALAVLLDTIDQQRSELEKLQQERIPDEIRNIMLTGIEFSLMAAKQYKWKASASGYQNALDWLNGRKIENRI